MDSANAPSCMRIDYELITQNHRAWLLPEVPGISGVTTRQAAIRAAACRRRDESLPHRGSHRALVPGTRSANREFSRFVARDQ